MRSLIAVALLTTIGLGACKHAGVDNQVQSAPQARSAAGGFDWRDSVIYFAFVDRFLDSDGKVKEGCDVSRKNSRITELSDYMGGDWAGVTRKIQDGYFNSMGVNTLWLTVPVENSVEPGAGIGNEADRARQYSSYHGYWPLNMESVDSCFGDLNDIKRLVAAAHAKGIKVLFDFAMVHIHKDSDVYKKHPEWFWPNKRPATSTAANDNCICGDGCSWDGVESTQCWFTDYLPHWNYTNAAARQYSVNAAIKLAKDTGIDGFRLDAIRHVDLSWLTDLRSRIQREIVPHTGRFYMVGETFNWDDRDYIKSFVNPQTMLDGQFDFPLRKQILLSVLVPRAGLNNPDVIGMDKLAEFMEDNDDFYGPDAIMSTWVGNHDIGRVIHTAEDRPVWNRFWADGKWQWNDLQYNSPGDDSRAVNIAWEKSPQLPRTRSAFERLRNAFAVIFTNRGAPLIYYGDEIGLPGAGDPDNRRMMQFGQQLAPDQRWLLQQVSAMLKVRREHPALTRGKRITLKVGEDFWVYKMQGEGDQVYVAINRSDKPLNLGQIEGLPDGLKDQLGGAGAPTQLAPRQTRILTLP